MNSCSTRFFIYLQWVAVEDLLSIYTVFTTLVFTELDFFLLLIFTSYSSHIKLQLWLCVLNVVFYLLKPHDGE